MPAGLLAFETDIVLRLALLFAHVIAVCLATGTVLLKDLDLLRGRRLDPAGLEHAAHVVKLSLAALWVSGLGMAWIDTGGNLSAVLAMPKLLSKICVVVVLTLNGLLLHAIAFPALTRVAPPCHRRALLCAVLGAVSTTSWLYAAFLGIARPVAERLDVAGFLALYVVALLFAIGLAVGHVRFVVYALMAARSPLPAGTAD